MERLSPHYLENDLQPDRGAERLPPNAVTWTPLATSAVCTSLRCRGPARAAGVARGVRGCGRAGGLLRSPVAGGGSW